MEARCREHEKRSDIHVLQRHVNMDILLPSPGCNQEPCPLARRPQQGWRMLAAASARIDFHHPVEDLLLLFLVRTPNRKPSSFTQTVASTKLWACTGTSLHGPWANITTTTKNLKNLKCLKAKVSQDSVKLKESKHLISQLLYPGCSVAWLCKSFQLSRDMRTAPAPVSQLSQLPGRSAASLVINLSFVQTVSTLVYFDFLLDTSRSELQCH